MPGRRKKPKRRENRASLIILIVLAFLLLLATALFVSRLPQDEAWQLSRPEKQTTEQLTAGFSCDSSQAQSIYPFQDGFIRLTPERISGLDLSGNEMFTIDIDFTAPFLVKNSSWLLVADQEGTDYVMLDRAGLVHQGSLTGKISGAAVSQAGMIALIQEQKKSTGVVSVLDETGRHLYDCHFAESGYVLAVNFAASADYFDVSIINTDSSALQAIIKRFALDGTALGQLQPTLAELAPLLMHNPAGDLLLYGQKSLYGFSFTQQEALFEHEFSNLTNLVASREGYWLLARQRPDSPSQLYYLDAQGQLQATGPAAASLTGPAAAGDYAAVGQDDQIIVINSNKQKVVLELALPARLVRFDFYNDNLYLVASNGVYRLDLAA